MRHTSGSAGLRVVCGLSRGYDVAYSAVLSTPSMRSSCPPSPGCSLIHVSAARSFESFVRLTCLALMPLRGSVQTLSGRCCLPCSDCGESWDA